jgi:hypothetical protein
MGKTTKKKMDDNKAVERWVAEVKWRMEMQQSNFR